MNTGYNPKNLYFGKKGLSKLLTGLTKISDAVKSTLGPSGNTVLIESPHHLRGITVTKDGVTVAKSIDLLDPVENLAVRIVKEAADRTASGAGDGTTTAIVLTEAIIHAALPHLAGGNRTEILRDLVSETEKVVKTLRKRARPVGDKRLLDVATISANNDREVGQIIADAYNAVGTNGIVTVERSKSSATYAETTTGIKVDRGYSSPLFVNNQKHDECILDNPAILVSDAEITNVLQIERILKPIISDGKPLLIIAPCSTNVLNTLAANVVKNGLKICVIQPPNFGYKMHELMSDIAISVGATYFSEKTGDDLSIIDYSDLGTATRIIADRDKTLIMREGEISEEIKTRVDELWVQHDSTEVKADKEFIMSRIASLTGGIGVIYVGGNTDLEQKELHDRIDDAVCAVRSALQEGILPGAGLALFRTALAMSVDPVTPAQEILAEALKAPLTQILNNADLDPTKVYGPTIIDKGVNYGYDLKTGKYGDLYRLGVIDPMKVTKSALQNAVSVAVTLLSTNAIVTMAREIDTNEGGR